MYALEAAFLLITAAWLVVTNTTRATRTTSVTLFLAGLVVTAAAFALGEARIHMLPAALIFIVLSFFLLRRGYSHIAVRSVGVLFGSIFVAASVLLALALPVVTLPAPDGPHTVGVTSFTLVDASRDDAMFGAAGRPREIYVQVWYPGALPENGPAPRPRGLWAELYRPPVLDVIFGYLGGMKTHSYPDLPLSPSREFYPAILFSPSAGGIAEQNTLLMEHLASHGYIVFGVTHPHFGLFTTYSDGSGVPSNAKIMEATSQQGAVDLDEIKARAELAASPLERAGTRLEYFERGTLLNGFMEILVGDLGLLLDAVTMAGDAPAVPALVAGRVDVNQIGLVGMSLGGGAVTALCKEDVRCHAAVNLDGGLWGNRTRQPLTVPYLVVAHPDNAHFFEHDLLTSEAPYYAITVAGAEHTDFMDISLFAPVLRWLGVTGSIEGERVIDIMNVLSLRFFDAYVRGTVTPALEPEGFPELSTQTNAPRLVDARPTSSGQ
jgi:predicted dienelactone hydrolase